MSPLRTSRRSVLQATAAVVAAPFIQAAAPEVLGQGEHRYRELPNWGVLDDKTPVKNCHGIVQDREGHIILLTDHTANNVIVYPNPA